MTQAVPKIVSLKRWHRRTFLFQGQEIELEVKALTRAEGPDFLRAMDKIGKEWAALAEKDDVEFLRLMDAEVCAQAFESYVRIAPGQEILWEDEPATAATLYREGNSAFVFGVLLAMQSLAMLNSSEGKASGSRSGSSSEQTRNGDSAASGTAFTAGTPSSTVTPILPVLEPSAPSTTA